ncbi:glycosyltransferase family 4 protein [Corynebacterium aurimucosum]|uniref:glycosyltransferase family 4 protein n=1 Tax=Corynebacterium aurimucosum TaxID=169292 RepID=UPI0011AF645A|nr:glycosyltransferase family 4 protein [Corynebacterium aurimucosum]
MGDKLKPLMVMAVGNTVEGDSRVEKMAVSARDQGYEVVIVGMKQRDVSMLGSYERIPIYRLVPDWSEYLDWRRHQPKEEMGAEDYIDQENEKIRAEVASFKSKTEEKVNFVLSVRNLPRLVAPSRFRQPLDNKIDVNDKLDPVFQKVIEARETWVRAKLNKQNLSQWLRSGQPGQATELWPQISGFEDLFLRAFRELQPDIIHVHDRHPMSAAKLYQDERLRDGVFVPWIYDAHEYLPGQRFSGPARHRYGWLALESEMIQYANHVITVSAQLADKLQTRHHLEHKPSVVVNAPSSARILNSDSDRQSLRDELGLGDKPLLVYVGKLAERRGIYTAVEAMPFLPNVHLAFVGSKDKTPRAEIEKLAKKHKVSSRVHIVDYVPSKHVTSYVSSADIGLSPLYGTKAHHQALATKIREYIQAGLPIVGTDLQAQGAFIRETKVGCVHEERNPRSFAKAVGEVLRDLPRFCERVELIRKDHSWESQEVVLGNIWQQFVSTATEHERTLESPVVAPPFRRGMLNRTYPLLRLLTTIDETVALAWKGKIYLQQSPLEWRLLGNAYGTVNEQLRTWNLLLETTDHLVTLDYEPLFEDTLGTGPNLKRQLGRSGIDLYAFVSDDQLADPYEEMALIPGSHWEYLDKPILVRLAANREVARKILRERDAKLISTSPGVLKLGLPSVWLPNFSLDQTTMVRQDIQSVEPIRIGILSEQRPEPVLSALMKLREDNGFFEFVDVNEARGCSQSISILIDRIGSGFHSSAALTAMQKGIPVLASYDPGILDNLEFSPPYLPVSLASIDGQVRKVASELVSHSSKYAGEAYGNNDEEQLSAYLEYLAELANPFVSYH